LDTAGEDDYQNMMDMWISFGEGFLLVFAINDKESFELLKGKYTRVMKGKHGIKCPIVLIGNKQDLEKERQIEKFRGEKLCNDYQLDFFFETSAKSGFNVKEIFVIAAKILSRQLNEIKSELKNNKKKKLEGKSKLILGNSFLENNKKHCC
jgi:small GTP-binding protein